MSGPDRAGTAGPVGEIPRRTRAASQPDRRLARLHGAEHPQSLVPTLVGEDTSAVPTGPSIARPSSDRNARSRSIVTRSHPGPTPEEPTGRAVNTLMLLAFRLPILWWS